MNTLGKFKATGECFIIPNKASYVKDFYLESARKDIMSLAKLNGFCDTDFKAVQIWITSEQLMTENLRDHQGSSKSGAVYGINTSNVPVDLFEGKKEGDVVSIKFPAFRIIDGVTEDIILKLDLKLSQTKYRYRNFGRFEEVLDRVSA